MSRSDNRPPSGPAGAAGGDTDRDPGRTAADITATGGDPQVDVAVIDDPAVAASVLDPMRARILTELRDPGSASSVAAAIDVPRQKVNYHLRALEASGLVSLVETRPRRGLTERIVKASARSYALSPDVLGRNAVDPNRTDRLSARYLIALAARMIREIGQLAHLADLQGRTVATLAIDTDIRFRSPADRAAFTDELAATVRSLAARYHTEDAVDGRWHRLVVAAHPSPTETTVEPHTDQNQPEEQHKP